MLVFREEWIQAIHSVSDNLKVTEETGSELFLDYKAKKKVVSCNIVIHMIRYYIM